MSSPCFAEVNALLLSASTILSEFGLFASNMRRFDTLGCTDMLFGPCRARCRLSVKEHHWKCDGMLALNERSHLHSSALRTQPCRLLKRFAPLQLSAVALEDVSELVLDTRDLQILGVGLQGSDTGQSIIAQLKSPHKVHRQVPCLPVNPTLRFSWQQLLLLSVSSRVCNTTTHGRLCRCCIWQVFLSVAKPRLCPCRRWVASAPYPCHSRRAAIQSP